MSKKAFLYLSVFIFHTVLYAQQLLPLNEEEYLNRINKEIKNTKDEKSRVYSYLLLSEYWITKDSMKSVQALEHGEKLSQKALVDKGVLQYYQALFYSNYNQKEKAKKLYQDAIKNLERDGGKLDLLVKAWYNYGYIQIEDKGYDYFVKALTEHCIPLSEKINNKELLAYNYTQLGITFMSVGQFDTAEEYHKKALEQLTNIPENSVHLITYFNLVSNYCYKPDSESAKIYLDKAKNILLKFPESQHYTNYYYQEAMYFTTKEKYKEALVSLQKGIDLAKERNQNKLLHMLYFRVYNVYLMQKDYISAKRQLEEILEENVLSREAVNRKIAYTQLASVNNILGNNEEAYEWMKKANVLSDSLQQNKLLEKMNELEVLYQTSEKQQIINTLEQEKKQHKLIERNKNLRISILATALVLSLIIAFLVFLTYKKQQKLNQQINISHQQDLLHIEQERKFEATQAVLRGEEQERQRIAQDLHDSMGGMLANIRMRISASNGVMPNDILEKIDRAITEMRRISRNLMPETLKNLGLVTALKELCESMTYDSIKIQFEAYGVSDDISFDVQLVLYRIVQESLSNTLKYAQATNVIVQIIQHENVLNLTIEDDGVGFDKSEVVYGLGLKNIENRIQMISGMADIVSAKGEGTTVNVECYV